jgi:hypothetical protein
MLVPNLLPKVVPHSGSRLLPRFIVRIRGRLVASKPPSDIFRYSAHGTHVSHDGLIASCLAHA